MRISHLATIAVLLLCLPGCDSDRQADAGTNTPTPSTTPTGCNQGSATVTFGDGAAFTFGPVALTKMACSNERNELEARIMNLLGLPSYWSAHDGTLSIYPATVTDTGMLFHAP